MSTTNNTQSQQPSLVGGHAEYIKGVAQVGPHLSFFVGGRFSLRSIAGILAILLSTTFVKDTKLTAFSQQ